MTQQTTLPRYAGALVGLVGACLPFDRGEYLYCILGEPIARRWDQNEKAQRKVRSRACLRMGKVVAVSL